MHLFRRFIQFLALICLVACTSSMPDNYDDLIHSPCLAPCWYGVVPGKTTKAELVKLIPAFPHYQKSLSTWLDDKFQVSWSVPITEKSSYVVLIGDNLAGLQIDLDENIVSSIRIDSILNKSFKYKDLGLTLEDAINAYGKPSDLFLDQDPSGKFQKLILVYSNQGVLVSVEIHDLSNTATVSVQSSLPIRDVVFFVPPDFKAPLSELASIREPNLLLCRLSWQGYTTINFPHNLQEC